jgi:hypothetical protein
MYYFYTQNNEAVSKGLTVKTVNIVNTCKWPWHVIGGRLTTTNRLFTDSKRLTVRKQPSNTFPRSRYFFYPEDGGDKFLRKVGL